MTNEEKRLAAAETGGRLARRVLARAHAARQERAAALLNARDRVELRVRVVGPRGEAEFRRESAGFLVALGDSWFDYPFHDVLERLEHKFGYDVEDAAHFGALIEEMAYAGGQIDKFAQCLDNVSAQSGGPPRAILLSGGGNDIVGGDLGVLLNSAQSPIAGWNDEIVSGLIDERVLTSYHCVIQAINDICVDYFQRVLPIVVHGYDYAVPDGRGLVFQLISWLRPGFHEKGFFDDLTTNRVLMRDLIDRLNTALSTLAPGAQGNVHYLNLRNTLCSIPGSSTCDYTDSWDNELHPTKDGFEAVAKSFADLIATLPL
jgi:lysophospholipase L1-like esterase